MNAYEGLFEMPDPPTELADYSIMPVSVATAEAVVVANHYLHRTAPMTNCWGIYGNDACWGVITYGSPASAPLCRGIAGPEHEKNVYELTRLWIDDRVPRNGESWLIANTLKLLDKEFVVSFAEPARGHLGIVYQATNWLYTGLSEPRSDLAIAAEAGLHPRTVIDGRRSGIRTVSDLRRQYGDDAVRYVERPRKHRYVFINAPRVRRRHLLQQLRYPVQPYPKNRRFPAAPDGPSSHPKPRGTAA